jgi:hypothetical protein
MIVNNSPKHFKSILAPERTFIKSVMCFEKVFKDLAICIVYTVGKPSVLSKITTSITPNPLGT